jgi:hypothetical protein
MWCRCLRSLGDGVAALTEPTASRLASQKRQQAAAVHAGLTEKFPLHKKKAGLVFCAHSWRRTSTSRALAMKLLTLFFAPGTRRRGAAGEMAFSFFTPEGSSGEKEPARGQNTWHFLGMAFSRWTSQGFRWTRQGFPWTSQRFPRTSERFPWMSERFPWMSERFPWMSERFPWTSQRFPWGSERFPGGPGPSGHPAGRSPPAWRGPPSRREPLRPLRQEQGGRGGRWRGGADFGGGRSFLSASQRKVSPARGDGPLFPQQTQDGRCELTDGFRVGAAYWKARP